MTRRGITDYIHTKRGNIHLLAEVYDKLIVVLNIGGVMDLSEMRSIAGVNAILLMTQLGNLGGDALLDVLTGKCKSIRKDNRYMGRKLYGLSIFRKIQS